jgi:hypothetical protein
MGVRVRADRTAVLVLRRMAGVTMGHIRFVLSIRLFLGARIQNLLGETMKFTEIEEIYGDEPHLPNVGLGDYVAWCQQRFACGHPKFGTNIIMDGEQQRCRTCRRAYQVALREKRRSLSKTAIQE